MADTILRSFLAILISIAFVALVFVLVLAPPTDLGQFRDVFLVLVGTLVGILKDVYGFQFGSSTGSKDANAAMKQIAVKATINGDRPASTNG